MGCEVSSPRRGRCSSQAAGAWLAFEVAPLGASTFVRAFELLARYRINNWDAAILWRRLSNPGASWSTLTMAKAIGACALSTRER